MSPKIKEKISDGNRHLLVSSLIFSRENWFRDLLLSLLVLRVVFDRYLVPALPQLT